MISQEYMTFELLSEIQRCKRRLKLMQMLLLKLYFGRKH